MHVGLEDHMMFKLLILSTGDIIRSCDSFTNVCILCNYIVMTMTLNIVSGQG